MPLTDIQIRKASPRTKPYKISDGGGLHLLVKPSGSKLWRLKYRHLGREKLLSFGPYPDVSLKRARQARDEAREHIAAGLDPAEEKKAELISAQHERERTFDALAALYLEKQKKEGRAAVTISKGEWHLARLSPHVGSMPAAQIKAPDILRVLKTVEERGTYETAHKMRTLVGAILRFGIAHGWLESDPTPALKGALVQPASKSHAAITDKVQFGQLLRAIDEFDGQPATRIGLQLLALLYPRPGELRQASWSEFDLAAAIWTIPPERMKMRRPHRVPLPSAAIERLVELKDLTGHGDLAFPSVRTRGRPMSENTLNAALRRLGYSGTEMTSHGFRATFSTIANESGLWHPDAIERALAHVEANDVRRAYARGEHWAERVKMADWWDLELQSYREKTL